MRAMASQMMPLSGNQGMSHNDMNYRSGSNPIDYLSLFEALGCLLRIHGVVQAPLVVEKEEIAFPVIVSSWAALADDKKEEAGRETEEKPRGRVHSIPARICNRFITWLSLIEPWSKRRLVAGTKAKDVMVGLGVPQVVLSQRESCQSTYLYPIEPRTLNLACLCLLEWCQ